MYYINIKEYTNKIEYEINNANNVVPIIKMENNSITVKSKALTYLYDAMLEKIDIEVLESWLENLQISNELQWKPILKYNNLEFQKVIYLEIELEIDCINDITTFIKEAIFELYHKMCDLIMLECGLRGDNKLYLE